MATTNILLALNSVRTNTITTAQTLRTIIDVLNLHLEQDKPLTPGAMKMMTNMLDSTAGTLEFCEKLFDTSFDVTK